MRWPTSVLLPPVPDVALDRFAALAADTLRAPMAVVSLLDADRQVVPGAVGLPARWQADRVVDAAHSLCRFVAGREDVLVVPDVVDDERSASSLAVADFGVRSWIAAPLRFSTGEAVTTGSADPAAEPVWGVLCVMDRVPRDWDDRDLRLVADLAAATAAEMRSRVLTTRAVVAEERTAAALAASQDAQRRSRLLLGLSQGLVRAETPQDVAAVLARLTREEIGVDHCGLLVRDPQQRMRARFVDGSHLPADLDPDWREPDLSTATAPPARTLVEGRRHFLDDPAAVRGLDLRARRNAPGAVATLPLTAGGGDPLGALVLLWDAPRDTQDPAEQAVWLAVADISAQALARVQLAADRRSSAETLQRSMLTDLPQPDHLELRARYVPAATGEEVGGDWYDAVVAPGGATTLVIGDVTGHNMAAAASMAQLRSMLRTLVDAFGDVPSVALDRLEASARRLHVDVLATAVVARVEQSAAERDEGVRRLRWSNAGHPPPLLLRADGSTCVLHSPPDLLLGLDTGLPRHDHEVVLAPGETVLLYTDGLVEHRGRSIDEGVEALREALSRHAGETLTELLDAVQRELIGPDPDDDCALLALRTHPEDAPRPPEAGPGRPAPRR